MNSWRVALATFVVGVALTACPSLAEEALTAQSDIAAIAPEYSVAPPKDFTDVKLANKGTVGSQSIAVSPKNPAVFVASYSLRAFDVLQSACWVRVSTNAGQTWAAAKKLPMPAGNPYCDRSALIWAADGSRVYAAYSYWNRDADGAGVAITSSTDRGVTWSPPKVIVNFTDMNAIGASIQLATPLTASDARWLYILIGETTYFSDPANRYFARSGDRGQTWTLPRIMLGWNGTEGPANATFGFAGGPGGEILISYGYVVCDSPSCLNDAHDVRVSHSSDRGSTFQEHIVAIPNAVGSTAAAFGAGGTAHIIYTPWYEDDPTFGPYYVYSTKAPYTSWSNPIALNARSPTLYVDSPALTVSVCRGGLSVLHAAWLEHIGSGNYDTFYARKVARTGEEWSPKLRLSRATSITNYASTAAIAAGDGARAVALWGKYYNEPRAVWTSRVASGVSCP